MAWAGAICARWSFSAPPIRGTSSWSPCCHAENQHELCVLARKFRNLHLFGCWWFTNVPSVIDEITRLRLELLGLSFTPQHSDARVLDQLIYKWTHFRRILAGALTDQYSDLCATVGSRQWTKSNATFRICSAGRSSGSAEAERAAFLANCDSR